MTDILEELFGAVEEEHSQDVSLEMGVITLPKRGAIVSAEERETSVLSEKQESVVTSGWGMLPTAEQYNSWYPEMVLVRENTPGAVEDRMYIDSNGVYVQRAHPLEIQVAQANMIHALDMQMAQDIGSHSLDMQVSQAHQSAQIAQSMAQWRTSAGLEHEYGSSAGGVSPGGMEWTRQMETEGMRIWGTEYMPGQKRVEMTGADGGKRSLQTGMTSTLGRGISSLSAFGLLQTADTVNQQSLAMAAAMGQSVTTGRQTVATVETARTVDRAIARDARRYDGGFLLG